MDTEGNDTVARDMPRHDARRRVAVLAFSHITRDRRVLRQCALLHDLGFAPVVIAYANEAETIPYELVRWPVPQPTTAHRLKTVARQLPSHLGTWAAQAGFWIEPRHRWALNALKRSRCRLVIANDWPALVVAAAYKRACPALIHYDTHEFATLEFDESRWWRAVYKPIVTYLEARHIRDADSISTVGPKLGEALKAHYGLASMPAIVRNIPDRIALDDGVGTAWPLRILYHGQLLPNRGLETLIASMKSWREAHHLTIRGDGQERYVAGLKAQAAATGRAELVRFENAVKPDQVMPIAATTADVGVHFTPLDTDQRHFSLPNKLFEYIGSGLAVAVSPGADLRQIVEGFGVGVVCRDASVEAAAEAINSLTREQVAQFKSAARAASTSLCWESERNILSAALGPHFARL